MAENLALFYFATGTLLFFFWAYGIYAFFRDLRQRFIPKFRQFRRGRRRLKESGDSSDELDDDEQQLL